MYFPVVSTFFGHIGPVYAANGMPNGGPPLPQRPYTSVVEFLEELRKNDVPVDDPFWSRELRRTYRFSESAHMNQPRKDGTLVFQHPLDVTKILVHEMGIKHDLEVIQASMLHDICEDTVAFGDHAEDGIDFRDQAKEAAAATFGLDIASHIIALTKPTKKEIQAFALNKDQANALAMQYIEQDGVKAAAIKIADRIDYFRKLEKISVADQIRKVEETRTFLYPMITRLQKAYSEGKVDPDTQKFLNGIQIGMALLETEMKKAEETIKALPPARIIGGIDFGEPSSSFRPSIVNTQAMLLDSAGEDIGSALKGASPKLIMETPLSSLRCTMEKGVTSSLATGNMLGFMQRYQQFSYGAFKFFAGPLKEGGGYQLGDIVTPAFQEFSLFNAGPKKILIGELGSQRYPLRCDDPSKGFLLSEGEGYRYQELRYFHEARLILGFSGALGFILHPDTLEPAKIDPFQKIVMSDGEVRISTGSIARNIPDEILREYRVPDSSDV